MLSMPQLSRHRPRDAAFDLPVIGRQLPFVAAAEANAQRS
jgi:hypothetical protein